ncbi:9935_t:CDS:1, partial [Scutellospora calospora]
MKLTSKEQEDYFRENNKENPNCDLCNSKHFRCKETTCTQCCNLNKCNSYPCKFCKDEKINCEYSIIRNEEEFETFKELGMEAYIGQIENTKEGKAHIHGFCEFKELISTKKIKQMFGDYHIYISLRLRGSVESNIEYVSKLYNHCEKHKKKCRCDYFDLNHICEVCNDNCLVRTRARRTGSLNLV